MRARKDNCNIVDGVMIHWRWDEATHWLLLEGLVPLFGAGALYLLFGGMRYVAAKSKPFKYSWKEWIDPLGWLYGAAILAAQAGWKSVDSHASPVLTFFCFAAGGVSLLQLLAALASRGEDPTWQPRRALKVVAAFFVAVTLIAGYEVHVHGRYNRQQVEQAGGSR